MERNKLTEIGLSDEQVTSVMKLYNADIEPLKAKLSDAESVNKSLQSQVQDRDSKIDDLSKEAGNSQKLNQKIADLQSEIKSHDEEAQKNLLNTQRDNAIELALRDSHVRDSKAVLPFLDKDTIKFKDGELTGINEQIDKLKTDHDYLFNTEPKAVETPTSHATVQGNRTGNNNAIPDISKMGYRELVDLKANDPDTYNAAVNNTAK